MILANGSTPIIVMLMVNSTDYVTAETGATVAVTISKNGGAFVSSTNSVSEIASGFYKVTLTATETGTDGPLIIVATGIGCATWREIQQVSSGIPADASGSDISVSSTTANTIADHVLRRTSNNVEASSDGDTEDGKSLYGVVAWETHKVATVGNTITVYESDGSTSLQAKTVTRDSSAEPITSATPT